MAKKTAKKASKKSPAKKPAAKATGKKGTKKTTSSAPKKSKASKKTKKKVAKKAKTADKKPAPPQSKAYKTPDFSEKNTKRNWLIIDLENQVLGRAATKICTALRGKNKPTFTPHADTGDFVIAINVDKIKLTGDKWKQKIYHRYTGYIGGIKSLTAEKLFQKNPNVILEAAVKGMLPKNALSRKLLTKLKIYQGTKHPHAAQNPQAI